MFNTKKKYFKKKLAGVQNMIWDLEFKMFKTKELREEIRKEHDRCVEHIDALDAQIGNKDHKKDTIKTLKAQKEAKEKDLAQFKGQLQGFDDEISGKGRVNAYGQVEPSIQAQLDGLAELKKMLVGYTK